MTTCFMRIGLAALALGMVMPPAIAETARPDDQTQRSKTRSSEPSTQGPDRYATLVLREAGFVPADQGTRVAALRNELLDALRKLLVQAVETDRNDEARQLAARIRALEAESVANVRTVTASPVTPSVAPAVGALPDPGSLYNYRGQVGRTLKFDITGATTGGSVWGDGVYTDDSSLAVAAVHSGALRAGERGVVSVELLAGQPSYTGGTRNGVTTSSYGAWDGSYRVTRAGADAGIVLPDPGSLTTYRDRVGQSFRFRVTGAADGTAWGDGVYTDDSTIATAAVHAGQLQPGQTGVVCVTILPGRSEYSGCERNGVTTRPYQSWGGSFRFDSVEREGLRAGH